jgi:hypothetical protein
MNLTLGDTQIIIKEAKGYGLLRNQLAYVLATSYWETARTMKPVKEAYWVKNAEAWRRKNLRYYPWYGRGYVQLTWEANYIKASQKLGMDLTTNPDKVMEPVASAKILVHGSAEGWFTGKKLSDYITIKKSDFINARRVINGTDKARAIADIAKDYDAALKAIGYGDEDTPDMHDPAAEVVNDAARGGTSSTTNIATGIGAASSTIAIAKEATDAAKDSVDGVSAIIAAGPWVLLLVVALGAGWWIWRERQRKAKAATDAKAVM